MPAGAYHAQLSAAAKAAFLARLDELDATLLEPEWLGSQKRHRVRCARGHECMIRPNSLRAGGGICRTCAGTDPRVAQAAFIARLAELDVTLLEPTWLGVERPHRVRCAKGHECTPRPHDTRRGHGICRVCAGNDPEAAKAAFIARLAELDATLLEPRYLGNKKPHRVRCAEGHVTTPTPQAVMRGQGGCRTCARRDPKLTEAAFRASLAAVDAVLLEPRWLGANIPHRVRCSKGHECSPRPSSVRDGGGVCRFCAHAGWDVLYVVTDECGDEWGEVVKIGISSGDPRPRLSRHRCDGLSKVLRLFTGLPDGVAPELERYVIAELEAAGVRPVWGREYFYGPRAATRMLALIDRHPAVRQASQGEPGQLLPS